MARIVVLLAVFLSLGSLAEAAERPESGSQHSIHTIIRYGAIEMCAFHNLESRKDGKYLDVVWPEKEIQAQLNYMLAAREVALAWGFGQNGSTLWDGLLRIYGFETNYPKRHVDFPPHFHLMLGYSQWGNEQVSHYYVNAEGRITGNAMAEGYGKSRQTTLYKPGEITRFYSEDGKEAFQCAILADQTGLELQKAGDPIRYIIQGIDPKTGAGGGGLDWVGVYSQEPNQSWKERCRVRAEDDSAKGILTFRVVLPDGSEKRERIEYDPNTGNIL